MAIYLRNVCRLVAILTVCVQWATAQNLVPNPSFEQHKIPPCRFLDPPRYITEYFNDWYVPAGGSTDVFFSGPINPNCAYNYRYYDTIPSPSGSYHLGLFILYTRLNRPYREYMQVALKQPLTVGRVYETQLFVLPAKQSPLFANNMGMLFSTSAITRQETGANIGYPLLFTPQVNSTEVLTYQARWQLVSGSFVADKPYTHLTIGNFFSDPQTQTVPGYQGPDVFNGAYYYIDDVSVTPTEWSATVPNLGPDTTLCWGQSVSVGLADNPNTRYRWQDGSTALKRTFTQSGNYYVTATTGAYSVTDTLHVRVLPPVALPADTVFCRGETLTLAPTHPLNTFIWSDNSRDSTLTVRESGQYWVQVPPPFCLLRDTIRVQVLDCPGEVPNVFTPNGDGRNDRFVIPHIELSPWRLEVYNRWGGRVYETPTYRNDWDGGDLPAGVYYYSLSSAVLGRRLKGWVTLYR